MKKVTIVLSVFLSAFAGTAFAQNSSPAKISNGTKDSNPILIGILLPAVKNNGGTPEKPKTAADKRQSATGGNVPATNAPQKPGAGSAPHVKVLDGTSYHK